MDTAEIFVVLGGLSLIALTLWFFFGKREEAANVSAGGAPLYECPMHPWITSINPADNCSICGMKLVRRGASEKAAAQHSHSSTT